MRPNKFIFFSMLVLGSFAFSAFGQNFSEKRTERPIHENVRRAILRLPYYEVFDQIGYKVEGSTVVLFGKVRNAVNKSDAKNSVANIRGVSRVINNIEILPPSRFDETIRRDLYRRLANTAGLSRYLWHVNPEVRLIVDRGHVFLEGSVANRGDYDMMNIVANGVPNVFSVTNNLVIEGTRNR